MSSETPLPILGMQRSLSVLIPALNEAKNLEQTVVRLIEALTITVEDYEIVIVDDGSTDGTGAIADQIAAANANIRVIHHPTNKGLGYCYTEGYRAATKEYFVYIPGDNTWPYRSFVELFGNIGRADVITSFAINPEVRPRGRRYVSRLFTIVMNRLFSRNLQYFNGLTIYPTNFLRRDPATTFGFGFQAEVLLKALTSGLSYIEVGLPIDERASGQSKAVNARNILSVAASVAALFYGLRVAKRWRPDDWAPDSEAVSMQPLAIDEIGFSPDNSSPTAANGGAPPSPLIVVVVGASSGIGAALAQDLASQGHTVLACSRDVERLRTAFAAYPTVQWTACDVSEEQQVGGFVDFVAGRVPHVDALINCAGSFGAIGPIDSVDGEAWMRTIRENVLGVFLTSKHFLPLLEKSAAARIINMSGGGAFSPFANFSAYACSKAAVVRLTETLAVELAPKGISVNALAPGIISTPVHEATMAAGPDRAGNVQYQKTYQVLRNGDETANSARLDTVRKCVRALLSAPYRNLTGKTISANFDPWDAASFRRNIAGINRSELYTMRRTNLVNLPEGYLRTSLMKLWAKHGIQR
jgi:NAD(P)-dependent dehydrogenase (short-subunit alcohol dehydrogenase family)